MELIFTKQADRWVAEFIATADFNLHIEGVVEGNVSVFQRGSESGNYAFVKEGTPHPSYANVYDYDFAALIYPKFIKVSCATEPTSGIVTSDGEITEIKAQTKEIEVTSNGTTEVTPDAGFAYLNSVKVKTNVAQSGEGGGSATKYAYFSYEDLTSRFGEYAGVVFNYASFVKMYKNESVTIYPVRLAEWNSVIAVAVDLSFKVVYNNGTIMSAADDIAYYVDLQSVPQLTEEEFYTL